LSVTLFDSRHFVRHSRCATSDSTRIWSLESRADVDDMREVPDDVGIVPQAHEVVKVTLLT